MLTDLITVKDLTTETIEDVFRVCSPKLADDKIILKGREMKKAWLKSMLESYGSIIKIAYWDDEPAAQVMFYPEEAIPYLQNPREGVIDIVCIYNSGYQGRGIGSALMDYLIAEARAGLKCLGGEKPRFLVANPFNTGEGFSLENFYKGKGFIEGEGELFLEIGGNYEPSKIIQKKKLDLKREAHVYYNPNCEYSYRFAEKVNEKIIALDGSIKVRLLNLWESPREFRADGMNLTNVNGIPILSNVNSAEFLEEIKSALMS
jgi:GNAT superfamily N-acetyltransferase